MNKCINSKCKLWLEEAKVNIGNVRDKYEKKITKLKKDKLKCTTKNCDKIDHQIKSLQSFLKHLKINKKAELKMCAKIYCNEGCKDTMWQDGPADKIPDSLKKAFKKDDMMLGLFKDRRKAMFGKRTSVLKNHFYEKISAKTLKKIKSEGAISGCGLNQVK